MTSGQKLQKIHTFADDVAQARKSKNQPANLKSESKASAGAAVTTTRTTKTPAAPSTNLSKAPAGAPLSQTKRAIDFLQTGTGGEHTGNTGRESQLNMTQKTDASPVPYATDKPSSHTTLSDAVHSGRRDQKLAAHSDTTTSLDTDDNLETGTIIRDKKQKKSKLVPGIIGSVKNVFTQNTTKQPAAKQHINPAESRREVIASAARQSHNVPINDFRVVRTNAPTQEKVPAAERQTVHIKDAHNTPEPRWSHYVDAANQPEEDTHTTTSHEEPKHTLHTTRLTKQQTSPIIQTPPPSTSGEETKNSEQPHTTEVRLTHNSDDLPVTANTHTDTSVSEVNTTNDTGRSFPTQFKDSSRIPPSRWSAYVSRFAIIFVIFGAIGLGVSTAFFWFGNFETEPADRLISVPSLIATTQQIAVPLGNIREELIQDFAENTSRVTALTQFYPVYDIETEPLVPANTDDILQVLAFRMPGNLERSITNITFGSAKEQTPFLIFRTQDFDTAFAGMLTWEAAISADLAPWFGPLVTETFDSTARTSMQLRPAFFIDQVQDNSNIRVLLDETNTERITYGFVNPQTIIITTNTETFRTLKNTIQN